MGVYVLLTSPLTWTQSSVEGLGEGRKEEDSEEGHRRGYIAEGCVTAGESRYKIRLSLSGGNTLSGHRSCDTTSWGVIVIYARNHWARNHLRTR